MRPADMEGISRTNASSYIDDRLPDLQRFRATHSDSKWATGRQRAALDRCGLRNKNYDSMTTQEANDLLRKLYKIRPAPNGKANLAAVEEGLQRRDAQDTARRF